MGFLIDVVGREMVHDVGVLSGSRVRSANEILLFRAMLFRPVYLDSEPLKLTLVDPRAFNGESSSPRQRQSRVQFVLFKRDRGRTNRGCPIRRFIRPAF